MTVSPILIVDDEPHIVRLLSYVLTRRGYDVVTAGDGAEALALARRDQPPLIFLDAMLPQMDGFAVCAELRRDPAFADAYIVLLTAIGQDEARRRALAVGANECMGKPFNPREIGELASRLLPLPKSAEGAA